MSLHNFNSNTKSWKMYTNTLTSISGDDLLVVPSYGKDLILEVSANNDIFFKKGEITKRFDNLVSDYLDMSFVREASFNSLNSQVEYILQEISGSSALNLITSGISNDLLIKSYAGQDIILEVSGNSEIIFKRGDISYNLDDLIGGGGGGGFSQSSDYATYNILDITGKIIFTDNSTNVQQINDASLNNVDISGSLKVAGSISAPNIYTKSEIDASFTNVYTKSQVYTKTEIDVSFVSKELFDASLSSIQLSNVYTKAEIDVSFVSKELFETSYNFLLSSVGTSNESGDGGYFQNNDYTSYDILNITDTIIFTDNSNNVQQINDASLNNVDISGSLKVAGSISAPNIYTKSEIDASFTNVYTKNQVYSKTEIDASFSNVYSNLDVLDSSLANVYTRDQVDLSFVSKELFDASLSSIQVSNVYTKNEVDVSFVSKQLFETSYNVLLSAIGTGGGGGSGSGSGGGTSSIVNNYYNDNWNKLGEDLIFTNNNTISPYSFAGSGDVKLSADGKTAFFSVSGSAPNLPNCGFIVIYKYNDISNNWIYNNIITGNANENISRFAISNDAKTIIYRSEDDNERIRIKKYSDTTNSWYQVGATINGGRYPIISGNGKIVGISNHFGDVQFYTISGDTYSLYPPEIPMQDGVQYPQNINLSYDGNIFSTGYSQVNTNEGEPEIAAEVGAVRVFEFSGNSWVLKTTKRVTPIEIYSGSNINSISSDGRILAVGGLGNAGTGPNSGFVVIYKFDSNANDYIQIGQKLFPEEPWNTTTNDGMTFGRSIKLSGDGNSIVIGANAAKYTPLNTSARGACFVYKYNPTNNFWSQLGDTIWGLDSEQVGWYVNMSYDGTIIATGTGNASRFRFYGINNVSLSSSSSSSSSSLTSDVASLLASLTSRIAMLEATAIIRSFDTIVGPVNSFNIPIDLSNNESLQIDMSVKITGEGGYKMFLKYNTESSTANLWRYFGGRFVYGEYGDGFALWGEDMLNENNGLLVEGPNTNETIIIRIEVFRSYDRASPSQKFWYKASTLFHWTGGQGISRIDCQGETSELSSLIPTALYFNIAPQAQSTTNSSNSFMNVSYSIIKDMRRTALGGPIL